MSDASRVHSPYRGLIPYSEEDAAYFFGREADLQIVIANLIASRLTVLYGASGCGKSSVLRAGVVHDLRERGRDNVKTQGTPEFVVVSFSSWRDTNPVPALTERVEQSLRLTLGDRPLEPQPQGVPIERALGVWSEQLHTQFLVILDQFEEYFLYHPLEDHADAFAAAFRQIMTHPTLRVNVLISMREDAITRLDRFKGKIPGLFDNYLRLHHLDLAGARAAITEPIAEYNRRNRSDQGPITIEPDLVVEVLRQVRAGQVMLPGRGLGVVRGSGSTGDEQARVETPFLQLVLTRLWDAERTAGSRVLRLSTLKQLGGAERIVRTHLDTTMRTLGMWNRAAAARIFQQLVTPTGTKIAHSVPDLEFLTHLSERRIERVVKPLSSAEVRVLRPVDPPVGEAGGTRYEIFHDVLAAPVLEWGRQLRWRVAVQASKYLLVVALLGAIVWGSLATLQSRRAQRQSEARALASAAMNELGADAELSLLLAIEASERTYLRHEGVVPEAEQALHRALDAMRLELSVGKSGGSAVYGVAIDRDLTRIATAGMDDTVRVWDAASGEQLLAIAHPGRAYGVLFSPEGRLLLSAGDGGVRVWDAYTGQPRARATGGHGADVPLVFGQHMDTTWDLALSADGALLATGGTDSARVWNVSSGKQLVACKAPHTNVRAVAFNVDGRRLASAADDGTARVCDVRTGSLVRTLRGHSAEVYGVAWGANLLVTGSRDASVKLWDDSVFRERLTLSGHSNTVMRVAVNAGATRLATTSTDGTVRVWDAASGREQLSLTGHHKRVTGVRFSQNDSVLATASSDGTARLWDVSPGGELPALMGHSGDLLAVSFDSTGELIVTGSADYTARVWDVSSGKLLREISPDRGAVAAVAFAPRGTRLAVAAGSSVLLYGNWADSSPRELRGHRGPVTDVAFSPDGKVLATASADSDVVLWNAGSGQPRDTLHQGSASTAVAFSPDGVELATAGVDGKAAVWNVVRRARLATLPHGDVVTSVAFSGDGSQLATASLDWALRIWERDGATWGTQPAHTLTGHVGKVAKVAFRPDGARVASAGSDGTVREWDLATERELVRITDHKGPVASVAYSPDGSRLAALGSDRDAHVYMTSIGDLLNRARARVTRPLTTAECERYHLGRPCPSPTVSLIVQGRDAARQRNFEAAVEAFEEAAELDKTIDRKSLEHEARRLATASLLTTGERVAHRGDVPEAIDHYRRAEQLDPSLQVPAWALNNLCWFGSLYGHVETVMQVCDSAVARDTNDGAIRDSRGVARVLRGDRAGAITDFQAFVGSDDASPDQRLQRLRWIANLQEGRRPWTAEEFRQLRDQ
jgi:WD40 repeat protein